MPREDIAAGWLQKSGTLVSVNWKRRHYRLGCPESHRIPFLAFYADEQPSSKAKGTLAILGAEVAGETGSTVFCVKPAGGSSAWVLKADSIAAREVMAISCARR